MDPTLWKELEEFLLARAVEHDAQLLRVARSEDLTRGCDAPLRIAGILGIA